MILFISGGARSGKSKFAEERAIEQYMIRKTQATVKSDGGLYYIATAQAKDDEMRERVAKHQSDRSSLWQAIEEPFWISTILRQRSSGDVILFDCLTLWLSNGLFELGLGADQLYQELRKWIELVRQRDLTLILVSNDVNEGIPLHSEIVQVYMRTLGGLHQFLVSEATVAIQVIAGIPLYWKGELSE